MALPGWAPAFPRLSGTNMPTLITFGLPPIRPPILAQVCPLFWHWYAFQFWHKFWHWYAHHIDTNITTIFAPVCASILTPTWSQFPAKTSFPPCEHSLCTWIWMIKRRHGHRAWRWGALSKSCTADDTQHAIQTLCSASQFKHSNIIHRTLPLQLAHSNIVQRLAIQTFKHYTSYIAFTIGTFKHCAAPRNSNIVHRLAIQTFKHCTSHSQLIIQTLCIAPQFKHLNTLHHMYNWHFQTFWFAL